MHSRTSGMLEEINLISLKPKIPQNINNTTAEPDELHQKVLYLFSGESYLILQLSATSGNKAMNLFGVLLFFV